MDFSGINQFGSLTTQNSYKLSFKDLDVNGDGKITESEFKSVLEKTEADCVELSTTKNPEELKLTDEQLLDYELDAQIYQELNSLNAQISKDFIGANAIYSSEIKDLLKDFATAFKAEYTGNTTELVNDFKVALLEKYEALKSEKLINISAEIKSEVLDDILSHSQFMLDITDSSLTDDMLKSITNDLGKKLEALADKFISSYQGNNLKNDLTNYLNISLRQSDSQKMSDAVKNYRNSYSKLGVYIDSGELNALKDAVKEFFTEALNKGMILRMNGVNVASEAAIETLLNKYNDAENLSTDMDTLISSLSTDNLIQSVVKEEKAEYENKVESAFQGLTGDDVQVDTSSFGINYNLIPGYNTASNIYSNIWGRQSLTNAQYNASRLLENSLKEQFKNQLSSKLEDKGIPFEKVETIFESAFAQASSNAISACVTNNTYMLFFPRASFNVKNLVDTFNEQFNQIMSSTINEMNTSSTDMDLQDINYYQTITDPFGNTNLYLKEALDSGSNITSWALGRYADKYETLANEMINKLKSTLLVKSMAMCEANGIEFDNNTFNRVFDNAQISAVTSSTSEKNIFSGIIKEISFNPQNCLNTFTTEFKINYSSWVELQKYSL